MEAAYLYILEHEALAPHMQPGLGVVPSLGVIQEVAVTGPCAAVSATTTVAQKAAAAKAVLDHLISQGHKAEETQFASFWEQYAGAAVDGKAFGVADAPTHRTPVRAKVDHGQHAQAWTTGSRLHAGRPPLQKNAQLRLPLKPLLMVPSTDLSTDLSTQRRSRASKLCN